MMQRFHSRKKLAAGSVFLVTSATAVGVLAGAAGGVEAADRWPMILLGGAMALVGLAMARIFHGWYELSNLWKSLRVVGVVIASIGGFFVTYAVTEAPPVSGDGLPWMHDYEEASGRAMDEDRPMMIDFTADWCGACHELEAEVFRHPDVQPRLAGEVVLLKVDFDEDTPINAKLRRKFEVSGLPAVAFVGPGGEYLRGPSFDGKIAVDDFQKRLDAALSGGGSVSGGDEFAETLDEKGLLAALILVFVAGLLSSLTPCVYPLIPITIGIFGAKQADSKFEGFTLSLVYVFGIAITYSVLGVTAASVGTVFGGAMQSPWVLVAIALLFLVLGLASLGAIPFTLPGDLQTKLSQKGGAGYAGALVMGLVAGIIAAPCVGPIVAGILVYVAQQQDVFLGWILLMTFAFGMGMLFLVLGTFSSLINKIPRSGGWLEGVKTVFGVVFIAMGLYYARYVVGWLDDVARQIWRLVG